MGKEKFQRTKSSHVKIGVIGHVDHGRTKLLEEITKMAMMPKGEKLKTDWEMLEVEMSKDVDKSITIDNAHKRLGNNEHRVDNNITERVSNNIEQRVDNNVHEETDELKR